MKHEEEGAPLAIPIDEDRWRLGAFYVVDLILRWRDRTFTIEDLVGSAEEGPVDRSLVFSERKVRELIDNLVARDVLVQAGGRADQPFLADSPHANVPCFRVADDVYEELTGFHRLSEHERADLAPAARSAFPVSAESAGQGQGQPWADTGAIASSRRDATSFAGRSAAAAWAASTARMTGFEESRWR